MNPTRAACREAALELAEQWAGQPLDPVLRVRLLRDVLHRGRRDIALREAIGQLDRSPHIQRLLREQRADGGWGPFHSRSTLLQQRTASTEAGVERALALGLDASHPLLARAVGYLHRLLQSPEAFPDRPERSNRWPTGASLFVSSTLALVAPTSPALNNQIALWSELLRRSFASGKHRLEDEIEAHRALTGASIAGSYLQLNNRYTLTLLSARPECLKAALAKAYLAWLWSHPQGVGYLSVPLGANPPELAAGPLDRWLSSLELLARFPNGAGLPSSAIKDLWALRSGDGWDLGPRAGSSTGLPLSRDWRGSGSRRADWTTRILVLLSKAGGTAQ